MNSPAPPFLTKVIGRIPNRLALAGGWIDQPFVSRHNPTPPGSMVVVALEPTFRAMDRAGCARSVSTGIAGPAACCSGAAKKAVTPA